MEPSSALSSSASVIGESKQMPEPLQFNEAFDDGKEHEEEEEEDEDNDGGEYGGVAAGFVPAPPVSFCISAYYFFYYIDFLEDFFFDVFSYGTDHLMDCVVSLIF